MPHSRTSNRERQSSKYPLNKHPTAARSTLLYQDPLNTHTHTHTHTHTEREEDRHTRTIFIFRYMRVCVYLLFSSCLCSRLPFGYILLKRIRNENNKRASRREITRSHSSIITAEVSIIYRLTYDTDIFSVQQLVNAF
jgi:hypothetical protein